VEERDRLVAEIKETKLRLRDLTRQLDESPAAEQDARFGEKLQRVHDCVLELERALEALGA
jgi:hypothetical protein